MGLSPSLEENSKHHVNTHTTNIKRLNDYNIFNLILLAPIEIARVLLAPHLLGFLLLHRHAKKNFGKKDFILQ